MDFQPIKAEDKELICKYLKEYNSRSCDLSFTSIYLWRSFYQLEFTECEETLIFRSNEEECSFCFPIGKNPEPALKKLMEYCKEQGIPLKIHSITSREAEVLEKLYPGKFLVEYNRDFADYLYEVKTLSELKGKKFHGKKNHINYFIKQYDWSYEKLTKDNEQECLEMLELWKEQNCEPDDIEKHEEACVSRHCITDRDFLGIQGGVLRADGRIVAFALGEKINEDTYDVHVEKAFADVRGAYPMINQQFLLHEAQDCLYVNREEDEGDEGLRQAKLSYHPAMLLEKGVAVYQGCDI